MSILTRLRPGSRSRTIPTVDDDPIDEPPGEPRASIPMWPLLVLMAGALLSGFWVLALLWAAYLGLLWLVGAG